MENTLTVRKIISQFFLGVLAGMMIGIGGCVSLSCDNRYIGALLFSLGLFAIIQFGFGLFTGKVGYIPLRKPRYLSECLFILLGNVFGTFLDAFLLNFTRISPAIREKAMASVETKLNDTIPSMFILAVFCGMLMFLAVDNARISRAEGGHIEKTVGTMLCIMVFIICGFNHCIADMFYLFLTNRIADAYVYLPAVIIGNSVGGMIIPLIKMLTDKPLERSDS